MAPTGWSSSVMAGCGWRLLIRHGNEGITLFLRIWRWEGIGQEIGQCSGCAQDNQRVPVVGLEEDDCPDGWFQSQTGCRPCPVKNGQRFGTLKLAGQDPVDHVRPDVLSTVPSQNDAPDPATGLLADTGASATWCPVPSLDVMTWNIRYDNPDDGPNTGLFDGTLWLNSS